MKYPKVGQKFYWKDQDGNISEDICLKIEGKNIPTLETMFFTHITENGGGYFVSESSIVDSNSKEVKNFKKEQTEKKIKEISNYISQKDVRDILYKKLRTNWSVIDTNRILNLLSNE